MIQGERVKQIREFNSWTQKELAADLGVTQPFVAKIENGWSKAPDSFVNKLVFRSGFPEAFFQSSPDSDFPLGSLLFRSHAGMTEREQKSVHRHAHMAYELVRRMIGKRSIRTVPIRVPRSTASPEEAGALTRSELGLSPDSPVNHMIHVMESAGVLVLALPRAFRKGDAFSAWAFADDVHRRPIVVLSAGRPADRVRMSAAHELAHLVMHQPVTGPRSEMEKQAKLFASAFLLPAEAMYHDLAGTLTLDRFVNLKVKWGVAIQALIVRARQLDIITQRKYRSLFQRLSARGWRTHEPLSRQVPLERPRAIRQIAELLYGRPIDYATLAADVAYPEAFVRELMKCHAARTGESPSTGPDGARISSEVLTFKKPG